jgi:hypothetical protein
MDDVVVAVDVVTEIDLSPCAEVAAAMRRANHKDLANLKRILEEHR